MFDPLSKLWGHQPFSVLFCVYLHESMGVSAVCTLLYSVSLLGGQGHNGASLRVTLEAPGPGDDDKPFWGCGTIYPLSPSCDAHRMQRACLLPVDGAQPGQVLSADSRVAAHLIPSYSPGKP